MGDFTTCTTDSATLATLPKRDVPRDIVQHGKGGPVDIEVVGLTAGQWLPPNLQPLPGIDVIPYIYGKCLFEDIGNAIETATNEEHRIYILGWNTEKSTELKSGKTLEQYLKSTKAHIRAMLFDGVVFQPVPAIKIDAGALGNKWFAEMLNKLPNGTAILDGKHGQPATHHQKLLVVQGSLGIVAFIGGMDINPTRVNVNPKVGEPWHDVQVRIVGGAAVECRNIFEERWRDHPESAALDRKLGGNSSDPFPAPAKSQEIPTVTVAQGGPSRPLRGVRIGKTYPKLQDWGGGGASYTFAPNGIYTAWDMVQQGIKTARRWIYLEDQYLVSRIARQALLDKLSQQGFEFLLILMNGSGAAAADFKYLVSERNRFREDLRKVDKSESRWAIYTLKQPDGSERQKWCGNYMHSKTWIFDDEYSIVGSANCENRGYTLNTEAIAGVADDPKVNARGDGFARQLRIALWHKHLGVPHSQIQDYKTGLSLWQKLPAGSMVEKSTALEPDADLSGKYFPDANEKKNVEYVWTKFCDPDARTKFTF
jgi:phosphatidylserine/phosphatidylglycerophosphate/cardiolipin synthase-like enzyme